MNNNKKDKFYLLVKYENGDVGVEDNTCFLETIKKTLREVVVPCKVTIVENLAVKHDKTKNLKEKTVCATVLKVSGSKPELVKTCNTYMLTEESDEDMTSDHDLKRDVNGRPARARIEKSFFDEQNDDGDKKESDVGGKKLKVSIQEKKKKEKKAIDLAHITQAKDLLSKIQEQRKDVQVLKEKNLENKDSYNFNFYKTKCEELQRQLKEKDSVIKILTTERDFISCERDSLAAERNQLLTELKESTDSKVLVNKLEKMLHNAVTIVNHLNFQQSESLVESLNNDTPILQPNAADKCQSSTYHLIGSPSKDDSIENIREDIYIELNESPVMEESNSCIEELSVYTETSQLIHAGPSPEVVELVPNSCVYINKEILCKAECGTTASIIVRNILPGIFTKDTIYSNRTCRGSNKGQKGVNKDSPQALLQRAVNAIYEFARQKAEVKAWGQFTEQNFTQSVNGYLNKKRKVKKPAPPPPGN